ncbi:enhancer of split m4 protein-like [Musca autumnalis]|uniref:enhancer of split m4 protein-like n=1 Tax=Musca autumnalis TaxID=221902 RepID=UPI003CED3A4F
MDISNKKTTSYSMKKLLKQIFKHDKSKKIVAADSVQSLENSRNACLDSDSSSMESFENDINEILSSEQETYVPVHFVRTAQGTFFWTSA